MVYKRFAAIHVIVGVLDDRRPVRPMVCRPFTIPDWVLMVILWAYRFYLRVVVRGRDWIRERVIRVLTWMVSQVEVGYAPG